MDGVSTAFLSDLISAYTASKNCPK